MKRRCIVLHEPWRPSFTNRLYSCFNAALFMPFALDRKALRRGTLLCDSRRPSFTSSATAVSSALVVSSTLGQDGLASPEDPPTPDSVVVLCCAIPRGRASPTGSSTAVAAALVVSVTPGPSDPATPSAPNFSAAAAQTTVPPVSTQWHKSPWEPFYILLRISANTETSHGHTNHWNNLTSYFS